MSWIGRGTSGTDVVVMEAPPSKEGNGPAWECQLSRIAQGNGPAWECQLSRIAPAPFPRSAVQFVCDGVSKRAESRLTGNPRAKEL